MTTHATPCRVWRLALCLIIALGTISGMVTTGATPAHATTSTTYSYTGTEQSYTVPAGVTSVTITASGGAGGDTNCFTSYGGYGAKVTATVPVTPGALLYVDVGSAGAIGEIAPSAGGNTGPLVTGGEATANCGAGGGGASTVQTCSAQSASCAASYWNKNPALEPRLVVAGGGGGAGAQCSGGDAGGNGVGSAKGKGDPSCQGGGGGGNGNGSAGAWVSNAVTAGGGATQSAPGAGQLTGQTGQGMVGGAADTGGGGGGGGYYGGGGAGANAGGGAGSSWAGKPGSSNVTYANDTARKPQIVISPASAAPPATVFGYTGAEQSYTVPAGVTSVTITASGGAGGDSPICAFGGYGAKVTATVAVTPHQVLYVDVGSAGSFRGDGGNTGPLVTGGIGYTCGGGGGASTVQTCSILSAGCTANYWSATPTLEPRLVVAGGGGGGGGYCSGGDAGGSGVGGGNGIGDVTVCHGGGGGGNGNGSAGAWDFASADAGGGATQNGPGPGGGGTGHGGSGQGMAGGQGDPVSRSGGGGGGYYGGGGGGYYAGSGAGSSWAAGTALRVSYANDTDRTPIVMITPVSDLSLSGGQSINPTESVPFTGTIGSLTDPDDTAGTNDLTLSVNWGDGSTSTCSGAGCFLNTSAVYLANCTTPGSASACDIYGTHTYAADTSSPYAITITGSDSTTQPAQVTSSATVSPGPDDTTLTPGTTWTAAEGTSHTQVLGHWSDADGGAPEPADAVFAAAWPDGHIDYCSTYPSSLPSCFNPTSALQLVSCTGAQTSCAVQGTHTTSEESEPGGSTISLFATDPDQSNPTLLVGIPMSISDAALTAGSAALTLTNNGNPAGTCSQGIQCSGVITSFIDGSASCSGEGEAISAATGAPHYAISINWGDGASSTPTAVTPTGACGYSISGSHSYATPGSKSISVTITDEGCADNSPPNSGGCSLTQTAGVMVAAVNDATITGTRQVTGTEGTPVTGTVGSIADGDNTSPPDWSLTINWGDGTTPDTCTVSGPTACTYTTSMTPPAGSPGTIQLYACDSTSAPTHCLVQGTHSYAAEGPYAISLSLTDADQSSQPGGAASSASISPGPDDTTLAPGSTWTATEGASHTQLLGHWSDTDPGTPEPADASFAAVWPDGHTDYCSTYASSLPSCFSASSALQLVSCNAAKTSCDVQATRTASEESEPGSGLISLFATDPDQTSPTLLVGIPQSISDAALTPTGGNPLTGGAAPCSQFAPCSGLVGSFTDTNSSCTAEGEAVDPTTGAPHYAISITWGDGSAATAPTSVSQTGPCSFAISGNHSYAAPGSYTVTVTITDEGCADNTPANSGGCSITIGGPGSVITNKVTVGTPASSSNLTGHTTISADAAGPGPSFAFRAANNTMPPGLTGMLYYQDNSIPFFINAFGASGAALPPGMNASPSWCSSAGGYGCALVIDAIQCTSTAAVVYGHYTTAANGQSYYFRVQVTAATATGPGSFQLTTNSPVGMIVTPVLTATVTIAC